MASRRQMRRCLSFPLFFFWCVRMRAYKYLQSTGASTRCCLPGELPLPPLPPLHHPSPTNVLFAATSPSARVFVCRCSEQLLELLSLIYACSAPASPSHAPSLTLPPPSISLVAPFPLPFSLCSHNLCSLQELIPARETAAYLFLWVLAYSTAQPHPECSSAPLRPAPLPSSTLP